MKTAFAFVAALAAGLTTAAAQTGNSSGAASSTPETSVTNTSPAKSYPAKKNTPSQAQQSTKTQKSTLKPADRTSPTGTMSASSRRILKESRPAATGQSGGTGSGNEETTDKNAKQPIRKATPPASKTGGGSTTR